MTTLAEALRLTLLIGAAHADATPVQREQLRQRLTPLLRRYRADGDDTHLRAALRDVMGPTWAPSGEWANFLREDT